MKCISNYINDNKFLLEKYFTISYLDINKVNENPLFYATEKIDFLLAVDNTNPFINNNQLIRLDSIHPFYILKYNKYNTSIDIITF